MFQKQNMLRNGSQNYVKFLIKIFFSGKKNVWNIENAGLNILVPL